MLGLYEVPNAFTEESTNMVEFNKQLSLAGKIYHTIKTLHTVQNGMRCLLYSDIYIHRTYVV